MNPEALAEIAFNTYRRVFENIHVTIPWGQLDAKVKQVWIDKVTLSIETFVEERDNP